jgi:hypothetical protein
MAPGERVSIPYLPNVSPILHTSTRALLRLSESTSEKVAHHSLQLRMRDRHQPQDITLDAGQRIQGGPGLHGKVRVLSGMSNFRTEQLDTYVCATYGVGWFKR